MENIKFKECNIEIGKGQDVYYTLQAYFDGDAVVTCYKLNLWERLKVLFTGKIWLGQMTFGSALQPQLPTVHKEILVP